jgi:glyoxylase-like metal-dependent hydrolase (beta-lactamase superfamily II)
MRDTKEGPGRSFEEVAPGVRRLLAGNPSPFTFTGTQTYVVGEGSVAVIDPGPDEPDHVARLLRGLGGERIQAILVTHNHRDHSPASRALAKATHAPIIGCPPLAVHDDGPRADESFDLDYAPDQVLGHGDRVSGDGWTLEAVATPGHTSNHLCFALVEKNALFSGDHVMGWSTTIVAPPDGDMAAYMVSLDLLLARDDHVYLPTHGPVIAEPQAHVRKLIAHRRMRERQILDQLAAGEGRIQQIVARLYRDTDPRLHPAAARSVLAHLIDLAQRGHAVQRGNEWQAITPDR